MIKLIQLINGNGFNQNEPNVHLEVLKVRAQFMGNLSPNTLHLMNENTVGFKSKLTFFIKLLPEFEFITTKFRICTISHLF